MEDDEIRKLFADFSKKFSDDISELKEQVSLNCSKLDTMDKKLDSVIEIVTANGQGIETISQRVDDLEVSNI